MLASPAADLHMCPRSSSLPACLPQHLVGLAEWSAPSAGMFLWLRLLTVQGG